MNATQILQLIETIGSLAPELIKEGEAVFEALKTAINGTPGTPEHTAAVNTLVSASTK